MRVAIITVGDELLAGDIENTNASWLARRLTERGVNVTEITVIPDVVDRIAETIADHSERYDSVVVTGGLGSTPDDVTVEGVAKGLNLDIERDHRTYQQISTAVKEIRNDAPEFEFDLERAALRPRGSEVLENDVGIAPGFVCENVFVIPGMPSEMRSTFEQIVSKFEGDVFTKTLRSTETESHLNEILDGVRTEFDVTVGCYPEEGRENKRIKVRSTNSSVVEAAARWLMEHPEISESS
ncbi:MULTISPECIES: competence/damage-inducible protein A [Haloferacaceae]|uniref:Competence/damage-inducible protein A n=1 Tax=Halorubrum glutamatedens TaxID=2707018 RepID=A0ABD5QW80_9EURY|nr:molybdopterin-binding protein [Halobellus captivus]